MYRVSFFNQSKVYEVYARKVTQSGLYGFVELDELVFDRKSSVVVDPGEERLKDEFSGVKRTYIPIHTVLRIDEVEKKGAAKVTPTGEGGSKVTPFPVYTSGGPKTGQ
jgi:hypothetical protein